MLQLDPILNSPFVEPNQHWRLTEDGALAGPPEHGRRLSATYVPVAPEGQKRGQQTFDLSSTTREGLRFKQNVLVRQLRRLVGEWRSKDYPHVTHDTRRLLSHWRGPDVAPRLFFCQIEAAETLIWLGEAAKHYVEGQAILADLEKAGQDYNPGLTRIAAKMATGSGKTTLMAMIIAWQAVNAAARRTNFSDAFLIVCPGITIRDRLQVLIPKWQGNLYSARRLVPDDMLDAVGKARVVIWNYHAFKLRKTMDLTPMARAVIAGRDGTGPETEEDEAGMVMRVLKDLGGRENIVVLNDEAHHCYDSKPGKSEEAGGEDDEEDRARNKAAARLWINGLRAIARHRGVRLVYDVSATPFFLRGSGYPEATLFPWVVSDFSLIDAIESGIVKIPRVPVSDNAVGDGLPVWRHLWPEIRDDLPKKGEKKSKPQFESLPEKLLGALHALYDHYARLFPVWTEQFQKAGRDIPPVFIVVCQNTSHSKLLHDYIAGYEREEKGPDGETRKVWIDGALPLFRNVADGRRLDRPSTLLIDSAEIDSGETLSLEFKRLAGAEIEAFRAEVAARQGQGAALKLTEEDLLREVMNTVGQPGRLGQHIRCVVSVSMLTEGWDASAVTHILGVRAFGTELLCEQVVGRGLRRVSYDADDSGMFAPEYCNIFGIPFTFSQATPEAGQPQPPKPTRRVHAVRARADADPLLEIRFPRLAGYRLRLPSDKLTWTWSENSRFTLSPDLTPTRGTIEHIMGGSETLTLDAVMDQRPATVAFHIAGHALRTRFRDEDGAIKPYLFPQLLRAAREWLDACVEMKGDVGAGLFLWKGLADEVVIRIHNACAASHAGEQVVLPVFAPYDIDGSSAHVDMLTSKPLLWETDPARCHVNLVVADSEWERTFCETLEAMPEVRAYMKNHGLGFEVPYAHPAGERRYQPDFIVKLEDGGEALLNLVVEVKGYRRGDDALKQGAMRSQWVPAVNNDGRFGRWAFAEVPDIYSGADDIRAAIRASIAERI